MKTQTSRLVRSLCILCVAMNAAAALGEVWSYFPPCSTNLFCQQAAQRIALGYRAMSLSCVWSYASSIWLRDYTPSELQIFVPHDELGSNVLAWRSKGFRPVVVAAYGQIPNESYLISYSKDGKESSLFARLTASELVALTVDNPGTRVAWVESKGVGQDARYAGVLANDGVAGKLEVVLDKTALQLKISSYKEAGYRPVCVVGVAGTTGMTYTANFVEWTKPWTNNFDMSAQELVQFRASLSARGLRPDVITQYTAQDQQTLLYASVGVEDLQPVWRITGSVEPGLEQFDRVITNAMSRANCTRASFAVSKDGRLMASRGYTHHPPNIAATQPTNMYRLASISKTITAVTVMGLVEAGKLQLDDRLGKYIDLSGVVDSRWTNITVRHLLQHRGGWNRDTTFDPLFYDETISTALKVPLPLNKENIITYMKKQWLQAAPGQNYAYSNFGYMLLGMIIEKVTGQAYETFVRQNVLAPLGIYAARIGRTARCYQLPGEVEYEEGFSTLPGVLSPERPVAALPYGPLSLDNCEALGAWLFSAEDLVRYGSMFFEKTNCALLSSDTIDTMWAPAPQERLPVTGSYAYYGCGWVLQGTNQGPPIYVFHDGSFPGTCTFLFHQSNGYCWAILFNTRNEAGTDPITGLYESGALVKAIAAVTQWPAHDLFDIDADGLPDSYEIAHFGSLSASNGTADHDGDGLSDAAEWIALSSPVDPTDGPRLGIDSGPGATAPLQVNARAGRVYTIQTLSALGQDWDTREPLSRFNGDGFIHTIPVGGVEPASFYRLSVSLRAKPPTAGLLRSKQTPVPIEPIPDFTQSGLWPRHELVPRHHVVP